MTEIIVPQSGAGHRSERRMLKRIRYIKVVRHYRRVTVIQEESAVTEATTQQCADDLIMELLDGASAQPERVDGDGAVLNSAAADYPPRRPRYKLRDLLRLRW